MSWLARLPLPAACPFCHAWPVWRSPGGVCHACLAVQPRGRARCTQCALPLLADDAPCTACARWPSPLARCIAAVDYAYPWDGAIHAFKYQKEAPWARAMAQILLERPGARAMVEAADWLVPVPMALPRLRERGYNQSWELARATARQSRQPAKAHAQLAITRPGHSRQVGASRKARMTNMQRAFACPPSAHGAIAGAQVVLVDDVMTTGATLFALAAQFQAHGAQSVSALVFARTPAPDSRGPGS